jgi:hypothetical protein
MAEAGGRFPFLVECSLAIGQPAAILPSLVSAFGERTDAVKEAMP